MYLEKLQDLFSQMSSDSYTYYVCMYPTTMSIMLVVEVLLETTVYMHWDIIITVTRIESLIAIANCAVYTFVEVYSSFCVSG